MRNLIFSALLTLVSLTAFAQVHRADSLNEKYFDAKIREIVYRLNLTDEQKQKFVPIYRRYNEEMIAAWGEHKRPEKPTTSAQVLENTKKRMERQQRAQTIRIKYIDEFATVLNAKQVSRLYDVESSIQKKLANRKNNKGKGHNKALKKK